ncbi:GDYXXLXY domain-containing protein [Ramlibacter albus]|uniref:GDYXXLXY domain-containing protein n=1 Tax=Ramlibacter albus TaxID=2079448 RepID=UPI003390230B
MDAGLDASEAASRLDTVLHAAKREGVLPSDAVTGVQDARPWPVVLLTAIGAWLAVLPLMGVMGLLFADVLKNDAGLYIAGVLLLAAAMVILRSRDLPIFVEQLALPALLVGGGSLAAGLFRDLASQAAAALLCVIALGVAWLLPRAWLRTLLGAAACLLFMGMLIPEKIFSLNGGAMLSIWFALHYALAGWLVAMAFERRMRDARGARIGAYVESVAAGWLLFVVACLAWWSGMTFLVGGTFGSGFAAEIARELSPGRNSQAWLLRVVSVVCAVGAGVVLGRAWPTLRTPAAALVGAVVAALAFFMPALGGVLLATAWTAATQRWRLAAACALAAVWIVGAFYYQLQWPLGIKAGVLVAAAAVLGAVAWVASGRAAAVATRGTPALGRGAVFLGVGAVLTLAVANYAIREKETLIAEGARVFVRLAPVDPRSLMQGDYMRLNYSLPGGVEEFGEETISVRPYAVMKLDARGVAQPVRVVRTREPVGAGELLMQLTPKGGRWVLVSDAWFFTEGDGERWNAAKYGEFRVMPDGRALLVGLAGDDLRTIPEKP